MRRLLARYAGAYLIVSVTAGCGLDSNQDSNGNRTPGPTSGPSISGMVAKGEVAGASVRAYRLIGTGREPISASVTTDASGRFQLTLQQNISFPIVVEATGGSYVDEATGTVVALSVPLRAKIASVVANQSYAITPLTEIAARVSGNDATSIAAAHDGISRRLSGEDAEAVDITIVMPVNAGSVPPGGTSNTQINYGLLLAAVAQYAATNHGGSLSAALDVLGADAVDGVFDTTNSALADAFATFLGSARNLSGVADSPLSAVIRANGNNAPVAQNATVTVVYQSSAGGTLSASDVNGDALTYSVVTSPTKGTVTLNGASFIYVAGAGMTGADSFTFRVSDGTTDSNVATVSINIGTPANTPPVANNGSLAVAHNTVTNGTLSASDADGNALTYTLVSNGSRGTAAITNASTGAYTYTPQMGQSGSDSFTFRVNDGAQDSLDATISVSIAAPGNTAPVANNGSLSVLWNTVTNGTLVASDADGNALSYALVTTPGIGSVSIGSNGAYTYTPGTGTGTTSFTYRVNDGVTNSNTATVTISIQGGNASSGNTLFTNNCASCHLPADRAGRTVTQIRTAINTVPTMNIAALRALTDANLGDIAAWLAQAAGNTAPVANNASLAVGHNTATNGTLSASDADGNTLTYSIVTNGGRGTAVITNAATGAYTYTPQTGQSGSDSFTFRVNDGVSNSNPATISVTIAAPPNNAPVATDSSLAVAYNTATNGTLSASDIDNNPLSYSIVTNGSRGTAVITNAATGAYTYTPQTGQSGSDSFTFRVNDGTANSNTATVSVNIGTPANTPPTANNGSLSVAHNTATNGTLSASDADGNALTYSIVTNGSRGTAVITNAATGAYTYTPQTGQSGSDSFTFRVNDGLVDSGVATISVTIATPPNTAPVANNGSLNVFWNTVTNGTLVASDSEGNPLTYSLVSAPSVGSVSIGSNGAYTYTPGTGTGTTSFTYRANDGIADSNIATITITIQGGNPSNGTTLFTTHCSSCHTRAARQGRTVTQIRNAINTVPQMNARPTLRALTDAELGDIAAFLAP